MCIFKGRKSKDCATAHCGWKLGTKSTSFGETRAEGQNVEGRLQGQRRITLRPPGEGNWRVTPERSGSESDKHKSWSMPAEGLRVHATTDPTAARPRRGDGADARDVRDAACELQVQSTIGRAELTALLLKLSVQRWTPGAQANSSSSKGWKIIQLSEEVLVEIGKQRGRPVQECMKSRRVQELCSSKLRKDIWWQYALYRAILVLAFHEL